MLTPIAFVVSIVMRRYMCVPLLAFGMTRIAIPLQGTPLLEGYSESMKGTLNTNICAICVNSSMNRSILSFVLGGMSLEARA